MAKKGGKARTLAKFINANRLSEKLQTSEIKRRNAFYESMRPTDSDMIAYESQVEREFNEMLTELRGRVEEALGTGA